MVVALLLMLPAHALAQEGLEEEYHKNIKVYQPKPILKKKRAQVAAFLAGCMNPRTDYDWVSGQRSTTTLTSYSQSEPISPTSTSPPTRLSRAKWKRNTGCFPRQVGWGM